MFSQAGTLDNKASFERNFKRGFYVLVFLSIVYVLYGLLYIHLNAYTVFKENRTHFIMRHFYFFNQCYPQVFVPGIN